MTKVITKERLEYLLQKEQFEYDTSSNNAHIKRIDFFKDLLRDEVEELDNLTVTRLRPMSEAPEIPHCSDAVFVLAFRNDPHFGVIPVVLAYTKESGWLGHIQHARGWAHLIQFKPEQS
jgi:hypothetical protein